MSIQVFPRAAYRWLAGSACAFVLCFQGTGEAMAAQSAPFGNPATGLTTQGETVGGAFCAGTTLVQWYTFTGRHTVAQYNSPACGGSAAVAETLGGQFCTGQDLVSWFYPNGRQELTAINSAVCGQVQESVGGQFCSGTTLVNWFNPSGRHEIAQTHSVQCGVIPVNAAGPGRYESAVYINTIAKADIAAAVAPAGISNAKPAYPVNNYRLTYVTQDGQGQEILASALIAVPQKQGNAPSPVLSYQHGTIRKDAAAPSNNAVADEPAVLLASLGYIVLAPDYVGYGASKGAYHPYLMAAPSASVVNDLLTASRYWRDTQAIPYNQQLFMVGYSEGGYVTMAAQRALQAGSNASKGDLVKTIVGAGPYSVELTLNEIVNTVRRENPVLGALISPGFLRYLSVGNRSAVRNRILDSVLGSDTDVLFQSTFIDNFLADDVTAMNAQSNVFDWQPEVAIDLFHGRNDQLVPYANSTLALQTMQARGAGNLVKITDCSAPVADHPSCVAPYIQFLIEQLGMPARKP